MTMPPIYPELDGLGYSVVKSPRYLNAPVQSHTSGREVRIGYAQYPLWKFTLVYNFLRDTPGKLEYKTYLGFFGLAAGSLNGFCLNDPDDNSVNEQAFTSTVGGGVTTYGPLVRTYGAAGYYMTEPVGYIDPDSTFNLYVDGNKVTSHDPTWGYTLDQSLPVNQKIVFNAAPPAGHILTVDMSYFYYARFSNDTLDFEKFLWRVYKIKQVELLSLRG